MSFDYYNGKAVLEEKIKLGQKLNTYNWTHMTTHTPVVCWGTGETVPAGTEVVRGQNRIEGPMHYPPTIWFTEEEFLVRRLKGQV